MSAAKEKWDPETLEYLIGLQKAYGYKSLAEVESKLSEGFDNKKRIHLHATVKVNGVLIPDLDKDIAPLVVMLNTLAPTGMTCQYDGFGWASISFGYLHFRSLMKKLRLLYIKKYGEIEDETVFQGIYKRLLEDDLRVILGEFEGEKDLTMTVLWNFHPNNIQKVTEELADLLGMKIPVIGCRKILVVVDGRPVIKERL